MENKSVTMQKIFSKLSEKNKNMMILIARSVDMAQENSASSVKHMKKMQETVKK